MNTAKEFVSKIIKKNQYKIMQRVKTLPKLMSVGLISTFGLLPLTWIPHRGAVVYAQQTTQQVDQVQPTTDPWYQSLEIARSKVEAALSPGAFGHGVPGLHNLSTNEIMLTFGIAALMGILAFMVYRMILSRPKKIGKDIVSYQ